MADSIDHLSSTSPSKLHDAFFREMMINPKVQREFLENYLPASIKEGLDWSAIRTAPDHFVTAEWSHRNADLLFELSTHGNPLYFYLLLEHQSKPDRLMPLRLLEYQVQIWRKHLKKHRNDRLPYIHGMVFHTGKNNYHFSLSIKDLIEGPAELLQKLWNQPFDLIDLNQQDFAHLAEYANLSAMLSGFRLQFTNSISELCTLLAEVLSNLPVEDKRHQFDIILKYLFFLFEELEPEQLAEVAKKMNLDELRREFMSLAHRLIEKGRNEGKVQWVSEGRTQRDRELVRKYFAKGMSLDEIGQLLDLETTTVQRYLISEAKDGEQKDKG